MKWPSKDQVRNDIRQWLDTELKRHPEAIAVIASGSFIGEHWGVGSDLDLIIIVNESGTPFVKRAIAWDTSSISVPTDTLIYTVDEWRKMREKSYRLVLEAEKKGVWLLGQPPA